MRKKSIFYLACLAETRFVGNPEDRFSRVVACVACSTALGKILQVQQIIKNIYNEEEEDILTGIAVFDCTLDRLRNYGPQGRGTAGALIFWLKVSGMTTSADPEGGTGGPDPPWKITSYMDFYRE